MSNLRQRLALLGGVLLIGTPLPAFADMGRAPTVQGTYVSGEGGYMFLSDADISAYGISSSGNQFKNVFISPENGWFAGGMIGYASLNPIIPGLWFTRVEGYANFGRTEESTSTRSNISLANVDDSVIILAPDGATASAERENTEGGLRFERDQIFSPTSSVTWVISPFVRTSDEDARATCSCGHRNSSVDTWLSGVVFAAEPEKWVTPDMAMVGRLGAGIYGFNADGRFRSGGLDGFPAHVSDSDSGVGFRGQLGAGLKFKVWPSGLLETFAEADYFSDVGTAHLPSSALIASGPASVNTNDVWDLRAGARLTFALGGSH